MTRMRGLTRILPGAAVALLVLAAVAAVRTARMTSRQPPPADPVEIAIDAGAAAQHLAGAIRFPTVSYEDAMRVDRGAFVRLHEYLEQCYPRIHARLTRETVNGSSLLYTWAGRDTAASPVVLMGHLDVVPVVPGTERQWTHPPFAGDLADGFVWGRGALDDKSGVIAVLEAVETLLGEDFTPVRTVYLAFGHDEEVGGAEGAQRIAERLAARGVTSYALVLDEGGAIGQGLVPGVDRPTALIGVAEKGSVNLQLQVTGPGGHSSTPPSETNVGILARAVARLESSPFPARLDGAAREMFEYLAPEMGLGPRVAAANLWLFRPLIEKTMLARPQSAALLRTTTAPTMLSAGVKPNVLAPEATAVVNLRIKPGETVETVTARVREVIADDRVRVSRLGDSAEPSPISDITGPAFRVVTKTLRQVMPGRDLLVAPMLLVGGTDARHYARRSRHVFRFLPVVVTPEDFARFHGTDERVAVDGLAASVKFFYQLVKNLGAL